MIPTALPLTYTTVVQGRPLTYRVTMSPRARTWRLTIHPDSGLTIVLPVRSKIDLARLLDSRSAWIFRHLDRLASSPVPAPPPPLRHGAILRYLGDLFRLELAAGATAPEIDEAAGVLRAPDADHRSLRATIEAWYRRRAEGVFADRLRMINDRLGYRFQRVTIRDQKTRWGSCSARGNLAFNWRLVMAPIEIVDYVVAHELVHLIELSHSRAFWRRVAAIDPAYLVHREWLRDHGPRLVLGVPPS